MNDDNLTMLDQFLVTALWSTSRDDGDPLDSEFGMHDISNKFRAKAYLVINEFLVECDKRGLDLSAYADSDIGHDLWLTIHRHGAGFWDGDYGDIGDELTKVAGELDELEDDLRGDLE